MTQFFLLNFTVCIIPMPAFKKQKVFFFSKYNSQSFHNFSVLIYCISDHLVTIWWLYSWTCVWQELFKGLPPDGRNPGKREGPCTFLSTFLPLQSTDTHVWRSETRQGYDYLVLSCNRKYNSYVKPTVTQYRTGKCDMVEFFSLILTWASSVSP